MSSSLEIPFSLDIEDPPSTNTSYSLGEVEPQPNRYPDDGPTAKESSVNGYAAFVDLLLHRNIPIFDKDAIRLDNLRGLGRGGTYEVLIGELSQELRPSLSVTNGFIGSEESEQIYAQGTPVVAKHINFDEYRKRPRSGSYYLDPIETEALVLSQPAVWYTNQIVKIIGIGSESSPYDTDDVPQKWPYLITEFGTKGNLVDRFRSASRAEANALKQSFSAGAGRLHAPVAVDWVWNMPWSSKIGIAMSIAHGLRVVHAVGVVHGDVKLENAIWDDKTGTPVEGGKEEVVSAIKLCDFGSSLLLTDFEDGDSCRLKSQSPPWEAPEARSQIPKQELALTDIYSFGLLFARIMLNGGDPFDSNFNIGSGKPPQYDWALIEKLKQQDSVADYIIAKISANGTYDSQQIRFIHTVLQRTVALRPSDRVQSFAPLRAIFEAAKDPSKLAGLDLSGLKPENSKPQFDDLFDEARFVRRPRTAAVTPQFLDTKYNTLRKNGPFMKEIVQDLTLQVKYSTANRSETPQDATVTGDISHQLFLAKLHGWGTHRSSEEAIRYLENAALGGCEGALLALIPVCAGLRHDISTELQAAAVETCTKRTTDVMDRALHSLMWDLNREEYRESVSLSTRFLTDLGDGKRAFAYPVEALRNFKFEPLDEFMRAANDPDNSAILGNGNSFLHYAASAGVFEAVERLLSGTGHNINAVNEFNQTPLMVASINGHGPVVALLAENGADVTIVDKNGRSPLHFLGRFEGDQACGIAALLLDQGADINLRDKFGLTPLSFILDSDRNWYSSHIPVVRFLLDSGASCFEEDGEGNSIPLVRACLSYDLEAFEAVLAQMEGKLYQELESGEFSEGNVPPAFTALFLAKKKALNALLNDPVINALRKTGPEFEEIMFKFTLHLLSDDILDDIRSNDTTPLELAITSGAQHIISVLSGSCQGFSSDITHWLVLFTAMLNHDIAMVEELLRHGAKFDAIDVFGSNILHWAVDFDCEVEPLREICAGQQDKCDLVGMVNTFRDGWDENSSGLSAFDAAVEAGRLKLADFYADLGGGTTSAHLPHPGMQGLDDVKMSLLGCCLVKLQGGPVKTRTVQYLLKYNPEPMVCPYLGTTVFHVLWKSWAKEPRDYFAPETKDPLDDVLDIFFSLLEHFTDPSLINAANALGSTPLHFAARTGNIRGVKALLERGANVNARDNGGDTPLDTVGDHMYTLVAKGNREEAGEGTEDQFTIFNSDIETYIYLEISNTLREAGSKNGKDLGPLPKLSGEEAELRKRGEAFYKKMAEKAKMNYDYAVTPDALRKLMVLPPDARKDLGYLSMTLGTSEEQEFDV